MKPLRKVTWADVEAKLSKNQQQIEKLYIPVKQKKTAMLEGPPAEVARKLVEQLKNEARVI
jgi:electron transfer flavoprotein beta subunit